MIASRPIPFAPSSAAPHVRSIVWSLGVAPMVPSTGAVLSTPTSRPAVTVKSGDAGVPVLTTQVLTDPLISFALTCQSYALSANPVQVTWTRSGPVTSPPMQSWVPSESMSTSSITRSPSVSFICASKITVVSDVVPSCSIGVDPSL